MQAQNGAAPPPDKLKAVKDKVRELRDLVLEKESLESRQEEIAKSISASEAMTPEELQREKEAQAKRNRDRGGGMSR